MLNKSLYVRIVLIFIGIVTISLVSAFFLSSVFFHREVIFDGEIDNITKGVAEIIELTEVDTIPQLMDTIDSYLFKTVIVNEQGDVYEKMGR